MPSRAEAALGLLLLVCVVSTAGAQAPPPGFVDAATVADGLVVDMRYFGPNNFVGKKIDGYERPRCLLSAPAANALAAVQRDLGARGLGLKVFDCYRPARAVAHFIRWARKADADPKRKAEYYPDIDKRDLFKLGYIAARSGHSRGSTVDLSLVRRADGTGLDSRELDMGTPHDFHEPEIMAFGPERERAGAEEPRAARRCDAPRRLRALQQGVVALHAGERAVPRLVFRFSGEVAHARSCPDLIVSALTRVFTRLWVGTGCRQEPAPLNAARTSRPRAAPRSPRPRRCAAGG